MFRGVPQAVAALFGDRVRLVGEQAPGLTRTLLKDAIRHAPDVLLVVAHGYTEPTTASFSGLLLRPPSEVGWEPVDMGSGVTFEVRDRPLASAPPLRGDVQAEVLTAAELSTTALLDSELVVLLACSAGTGRLDEGDSPNNIAETLLRLGASSVIAALWDADFAATRDWVEVFFEAWLRQGRPKALAARDATRALYVKFDGQPERFGALTLRGDWI
jgi:CHAT domain-containing protein